LQKKGYSEFIEHYIHKLFDDVSPVEDITGGKLNITIGEIKVDGEIQDIAMCKKKEMTYGGIISGKIKLTDHETGKTLFTKRVNIGIMPLMTPSGSFIINGVERVIISQIVRSYGIFFGKKDLKYTCKLIPEKGPWLEIFIEKSGTIMARLNKSRKFPITSLLRVMGIESDEGIKEFFADTFEEEDTNYLDITLEKDNTVDGDSAAVFIYNKIRPGELIDTDSAADYIKTQFLSPDRIHLGRIARRKINAKT
jgi:DNA-directed RNA polymerase subunit beta